MLSISKLASKIGPARARLAGLVFSIVAVLSMAIASAANAEGTAIIEPATKKVETEFNTNLPIVLGLVGLLVAVGVVLAFMRKHAKAK